MTEEMDFALTLRALRESIGVSQNDMVDFFEMKQSSYSQWENGVHLPRDPESVLARVQRLIGWHDLLIDQLCDVVEEESAVLNTPTPSLRTFARNADYWEADETAREERLPASLHRSATAWVARIMQEEYGILVQITR